MYKIRYYITTGTSNLAQRHETTYTELPFKDIASALIESLKNREGQIAHITSVEQLEDSYILDNKLSVDFFKEG